MPESRPRVLAVLPAFFPSTIICVAKPLERLHEAGRIDLDLTLQYAVSRRRVARADVVVCCHSIDPRFGGLLEWVRDEGKGLIYDLDDNLLEPPPDVPGLDYLRDPERCALLVAALRQADVVRVYSPDLQRTLSAHTSKATLVSGPLDWSLVPAEPPVRDASRVRLVYATSRRQDAVGRMVLEPLRQVLDDHPGAELTIWGPHLTPLSRHPRVRCLPFVRDYDRYFSRFAREGFDVGLAPLPDDAFHRGKSNLKFREYAACGVAGVYSDMPVYNTTVVNGETGLLVADCPNAWRAAVGRLITDAALRGGIAQRARAVARDAFNEPRTDADWMGPIGALAGRSRAAVSPAASRAAPPPPGTVGALVRQAAWLCRQVPRVVKRHGVRSALDRAAAHVSGFMQLRSWKRQHSHRRASAPAGRGPA